MGEAPRARGGRAHRERAALVLSDLSDAQRAEIADLEARLGPTLAVEDAIPEFRVGDWRPVGSEVCMVIRRPNGKLLTMLKTFYPRGAHRLPTGGVEPGEPILAAALRETREETGLDVEVRRFLAWIRYRHQQGPAGAQPAPVRFHTFAFLLDERGGRLGALDEHEQVEEFREIGVEELPAMAARLASIHGATASVAGDWPAWGRFRAVVHRAVHQALSSS